MIPAAPAINGDTIPDRVGSPSPPRPSRPTRSELEAMFHHIMRELKYTHGRLPSPSKLTHSFFKSVSDGTHGADIAARFREILRWLRKNKYSVEEELPTFIDDHSVHKFVSEFLENLLRTNQPLIDDELIDAVTRFVSGEMRSRVEIARAMLVGRAIKQNHDSVAKYAQRFYQSSRLCPDESQASLCLHYLAGLKLEMQQACAVDIHGQSWNNLDALVRFSYGEEIRLQARSSSCTSSYNPRSSRTSQGFQPVGRSGKVAAIKSDSQKRSRSAADEAGPSGLRSCPIMPTTRLRSLEDPLRTAPCMARRDVCPRLKSLSCLSGQSVGIAAKVPTWQKIAPSRKRRMSLSRNLNKCSLGHHLFLDVHLVLLS
ncbi:hypothetical protein CEUSTIGMA_g11138.t1 [Chlamydomonas eustigma]|uniref:Retrotransposon gag domain-containing protein n=1 Tax=Chlamydomonas eustigma TaxID=1157962 RepID=A0A250XL09_9CHLO|nr:hypothetical protein CEUSTIGMA_g11138.t1 [Chlamydomonas eustigma]|eukprot:GAX83713.1 hypothetical protein CEUSTIGMA_g11138.t1 [Chlamydomonas eustigma]